MPDGTNLPDLPVRSVTFAIHGKPFAWRRARSNGRVRFKDKASEAFGATLQAIAQPHFPAPLSGPLRLTVIATFEPAKGLSNKKREALIGTPHIQRPDADNLAKGIMDSLNRIAWGDDCQIAEIVSRKQWGTCNGTLVTVERLA